MPHDFSEWEAIFPEFHGRGRNDCTKCLGEGLIRLKAGDLYGNRYLLPCPSCFPSQTGLIAVFALSILARAIVPIARGTLTGHFHSRIRLNCTTCGGKGTVQLFFMFDEKMNMFCHECFPEFRPTAEIVQELHAIIDEARNSFGGGSS